MVQTDTFAHRRMYNYSQTMLSRPFPTQVPVYRRPLHPLKQRYPWGKPKEKRVTVCIAAITRENYIATVSDTMVSSYLSSADACTVKVEPIHQDWSAMMAADDLTQCLPIVERAERYFRGKANTLHNARTSFKRAYQQHLAELAADIVLGRFGLDMETFTKAGKRRFTEAQFNSLCTEIRQVGVGCQFLVYGFDENKIPHLFIVNDPGTDSVYDKPGFCSIGSGSHAADGLLFYLSQTIDCELPQTLFNICSAKFMAEKTGTVGKETYLFVKRYRSSMFSAASWLLPELREMWDKEGSPRLPVRAVERIKQARFYFGDDLESRFDLLRPGEPMLTQAEQIRSSKRGA